MQSSEIRNRFLKFFQKRHHSIIPSASLIPENDPSVLFTTAGMQPLVPYLLGAKHPSGNRLANAQKCVRTVDIDEVGDRTHLTFFEMLGNWSLGDPEVPDGIGAGYFKEESIKWSYEFLVSEDEGLGIDPNRLYVTVFEGNENAPRDDESAEIWRKIFAKENIKGERIYFMSAEENWWSPGDNGPCGPDTEMFYDVTGKLNKGIAKEEFINADKKQKVVEVWNNVFMEYEKKNGKVVGKLKQKNVDTGAGLERLAMVLQKTNNVFDTDLFEPIMKQIKTFATAYDERAARIVADHIRTAVFMIGDKVLPSNSDRGYVLRRLLRRAVGYANVLKLKTDSISVFVDDVASVYGGMYINVSSNLDHIKNVIKDEEQKFLKTLKSGSKELTRLVTNALFTKPHVKIDGKKLFYIFATYGYPLENSFDEIENIILPEFKGPNIDKKFYNKEEIKREFSEAFKKHQNLSRIGTEHKFKGGLADMSPATTKLHTATHLMLAGLRKYLGDHVHQAGSNITQERTRLDFTHPEKVSPEILKNVENYVNEAIFKKCSVVVEKMEKAKAQSEGVEGSFWEKYPEVVNVYIIKALDGTIYSRELCGGPHVQNTEEIGKFKIIKEEAVGVGIRRIKAVVV